MKNLKYFLSASVLFCLISLPTFAQSEEDETTNVAWPELDAFHSVLSETFHPMEDGNYKPIRTRSTELFHRAVEWGRSTPPKKYNNENLAFKMGEMGDQAQYVNDLVLKNASDAEIKKALTDLHTLYHAILDMNKPKK